MVHVSGFLDEVSPAIDKQIAFAKKLGLQYMCPRTVDGKNIADFSLSEFTQSVKPRLDAAGLRFSSLGSPIGKVKLHDDAAYAAQLLKLETLVSVAEAMHCKYIRIFSFFVDSGCNYDDAHPIVVEKLKGFLALVKGHDVVLLHENEKQIYGDVPDRALALYNEINDPQLRLCYDASNYVQVGVDPWSAYLATREQTAYYHMKDCSDGFEVPLGSGSGRIADILNDLSARAYDGFYTLEPHTLRYALLRRPLRVLPFLSPRAAAVYRSVDDSRGLSFFRRVSADEVFRWQYENLVAMLKNDGVSQLS